MCFLLTFRTQETTRLLATVTKVIEAIITKMQIKVISHDVDDPIGKLGLKESSETLVIDFNNLLPLYSNLLNQIQTSHRIYPSIRATSQLTGDLGPEGLFLIAPPGWHSERNPKYPQSISIDFNEVKSIGRISLLPQDGHSSCMPKNIQIKSSSDAKTWTTVASFDDICDIEQRR